METDFSLGDWVVRPRKDCIQRGDKEVHLAPKAMSVLLCLARQPGEVISRQKLFDAVWPGAEVTDDALSQRIGELRRAFGDTGHSSQIIQTIPKVGFCLMPQVEPLNGGSEMATRPAKRSRILRFTAARLNIIIIGLIALALALVLADRLWFNPKTESKYPPNSIAVLPFSDMSPDKDQEYFSDGLSDTLIHLLVQVSGLRVTAKTSSFYFKDKNIDVSEIARQLKVSTVLEGSVQKVGNQMRVTAQLVNADDGTHLWSKRFDHDLQDIFAMQDEIAQQVVATLKVTLLDTEEERLKNRYQPTLEAYGELILGRHEMAKRTATSLAAAEQHFKRAIELDSEYALPYVYLSETYALQVVHAGLVFEEAMQRRESLLDQALLLDPLLGEAYIERASFHFHQYIQTGEKASITEREDVLKALELSPNYTGALSYYSRLLRDQGQFEEALVQIRLAAELDPMSPIIQINLADATWNTGRVEEALALIRRNIERDPGLPSSYWLMANYQVQMGHLGEAQRWIHEAWRRNPAEGYNWSGRCLGFLFLGNVLAAEECVKQLHEAYPEKVVSNEVLLQIQAYRGNWKAAIATLEASSERVPGYQPWRWLLADWIAGQGDVERARQLMADAFPELMEESVEIAENWWDLGAAMVFAAVLDANGETQHREALLRALEERIATMHRIHGVGYSILDVYIHAIRGDHTQAVVSLRDAIDMGWRSTEWLPAWRLREDWKLGDLRQDAEFIALMNELEADISAQRQWYEENKDKPLF